MKYGTYSFIDIRDMLVIEITHEKQSRRVACGQTVPAEGVVLRSIDRDCNARKSNPNAIRVLMKIFC